MSTDAFNPNAKIYGLELQLDKAVEGIDAAWPAGVDKLPLRGQWYTKEDFKAEVTATRKPWKDVRVAKAVVRQFTQDKPANEAKAKQLLADLKATMTTQFGGESETLSQFGFKPKAKRRALTSEQQTLANAKRLLTRKARGTLGKRQREAIKYDGPPPHVRINADGSSYVYDPSTPSGGASSGGSSSSGNPTGPNGVATNPSNTPSPPGATSIAPSSNGNLESSSTGPPEPNAS